MDYFVAVPIAHFSDGRTADVTALAMFTSQDEGVAQIGTGRAGVGRITALRRGDTFIVVSSRGQFGRCQVFVPDPGPPVDAGKNFKPANFIDDHVLTRWRKLNVAPAPLCDDATFLCGTLPEAKEIRDFLADRSAGKRAAKIEQLLRRPEYSQWWASKLSDLTGNDNRYLGLSNWKLAYGWWDWLRIRIERNEGYDQIVRNILMADSREGRTLVECTRWLDEEKPRSCAMGR